VDQHALSPTTTAKTLASGYLFRFKRERQLTRENRLLRERVAELETAQTADAKLVTDSTVATEMQVEKMVQEHTAILEKLNGEISDLHTSTGKLTTQLLHLTEQEHKTFKVQNAVRSAHAAAKASLVAQLAEAEMLLEEELIKGSPLQDNASCQTELQPFSQDGGCQTEPEEQPPFAAEANEIIAAEEDENQIELASSKQGLDVNNNAGEEAAECHHLDTPNQTASPAPAPTPAPFNASTIGDWVDELDVTTNAGNLNATSIRSMYTQCMADISTSCAVDELRGVGRLIRQLIQRRLFSKEDFADLQAEYQCKMNELRNPGAAAPIMFVSEEIAETDTEDMRQLKHVIVSVKSELIKTKSTVARQSWQTEKLKLYCKERDKFILALLQSPEKLDSRQILLNQFLNRPSLGGEVDGLHFESPPTPTGHLGPSPATPFAVGKHGERNAALVDFVRDKEPPFGKGSHRMQMLQLATVSRTSHPMSEAVERLAASTSASMEQQEKKETTEKSKRVNKVTRVDNDKGCLWNVRPRGRKGRKPVTLPAKPVSTKDAVLFGEMQPASSASGGGGESTSPTEVVAAASSGEVEITSATTVDDALNTSLYNPTYRVDTPTKDSHCAACDNKVYVVEKMVVDNHAYHKSCFKCSHCNMQINAGTYKALSGKLFCKPHFHQMVKRAGNYDGGGFGVCSPARLKLPKGNIPLPSAEDPTTTNDGNAVSHLVFD
jgi:hypothetical protein